MTRQLTLLAVTALILPVQALTETLTEAWDTALVSHHQIAAAAAQRDAADYDLERARSARMPTVGISTEYMWMDSAPGFLVGGTATPPIFAGDDFVRAGAQLKIPVYAGGGISSGIAAAELGAGAAADQLHAVIQGTKLGVAEHYVMVLRAASAVVVANSIVASLTTHTDDTRNRFEFGAVPQNDYLAASVTLANARQRLLQAENALDFSHAAYNRFLGRSLDAAVALDPSLDIDNLIPTAQSVQDLIALAQTQRPELSAMVMQAESLRRQSDTARANSRPQVSLTGGYMFLENEFLDDDAFWMAGVSLQWNVFDGGRSRKQAASLNSKATAIGHQRADLETIIALKVRRSWNDREEAENRIGVAESAVTQATENLRVVRNRYAAGASTNVEVLDAEALREQSLRNNDDARFELVLAKLRLARAVGNL
jgi:outer membrane protein TolC